MHLQWKQPLIVYAVTRQVRPSRWFAFCFYERICGCRAAVTSEAAASLSACHTGLFSTRSNRIVRISTTKNYLFIEQRYHDDKIRYVIAKQHVGEILSCEK